MSKTLLSLARLTGLSSEELDARIYDGENLKDDALDTFQNLVLDKFKADERKAKDNFLKKGIAEKARKVEEAAKELFDTYGINADQVEDGIRQLSEAIKAKPLKEGGGELTPEQIKALPGYKTLIEQQTTALNERIAGLEKEKTAIETARRADTVKSKLMSALESSNASFGIDKDKAVTAFLAVHPYDSFQEKNGNLIPLQDGEPAKDKFLNPVTLEDWLKENWIFGFQGQEPIKTPSPAAKGSGGGKYFQSEADYNAQREAAMKRGDTATLQELAKKFTEQSG